MGAVSTSLVKRTPSALHAHLTDAEGRRSLHCGYWERGTQTNRTGSVCFLKGLGFLVTKIKVRFTCSSKTRNGVEISQDSAVQGSGVFPSAELRGAPCCLSHGCCPLQASLGKARKNSSADFCFLTPVRTLLLLPPLHAPNPGLNGQRCGRMKLFSTVVGDSHVHHAGASHTRSNRPEGRQPVSGRASCGDSPGTGRKLQFSTSGLSGPHG